MSTMVERVARALAASSWDRFNTRDSNFAKMKYPYGVDQYCDIQWHIYADDARAAIEAMMEPNEEMRISGAYILDQKPSEAETTYRAMIQAALKEQA